MHGTRAASSETHRHGKVGWQHLASPAGSREEVDRLHAIAVRDPKVYTRFSDHYYASFVEDDNGIRFEFMFNPPKELGDQL
ncbi:VOC family protein [Agromyces cerinus]|uniref:hypothetical protein n=1 Tax=Agromyces cerinus TaxID=33878 RepID=UPI000940CBCB|nr:hypothetical protein [Agromyces cerinus]